jgi:hypothetical protein
MDTTLRLCLLGLLVLVAVPCAAGETDSLKTLRPHPRLYANGADIARLRALIASDATARQWHDDLRARAAKIVTEPPVEYRLIGPRLLHVSREALNRIVTLGLLYRLDGDRAFAERAVRELMTISAFRDWHPPHFLDTAEMTHAAALGYDWLYDLLTPDQRAIVKQAIVEKGLRPALACYQKGGWWVSSPFNWNQVCNGGIGIGALAIADEEPALASSILEHARKSIPKALAEYEPDGGWAEGPAYWGYATRYTVYFLAALDSALGTDFGLSDRPGLARAGDFRVHSIGPLDRTFNYADAGDAAGRTSEMFWLARRYRQPLYAWHEHQRAGHRDAWALLWYGPAGRPPRDLPLDKAFRHIEVAFLRSAWNDPDAVFVGFKGGDNRANHSHLDLGTFVLDALGVRWAVDLGPDDYNLPGYFGKQRFTYYRLRTEGHNTLTLNGANQDPRAKAPLIAFHPNSNRAFAVADLSAAYPMAGRVWRGIALLERTHVLIQDEIETSQPVDVVWALHTPAQVVLAGASAVLSQDGKSLAARILSPEGARFETASADPGPAQARNPGITKLVIRLPQATGSVRLAVLLTPDTRVGQEFTPALTSLSDWTPQGSR